MFGCLYYNLKRNLFVFQNNPSLYLLSKFHLLLDKSYIARTALATINEWCSCNDKKDANGVKSRKDELHTETNV